MDHPWRHRPPHPPSFNPNPNVQPHIPHPFYDRFIDHHGIPGNLHRPFSDPRPWLRNPSLEYGQFHGGVGFKRMRDDEIDAGSSRISSEDERRLKLIRDHGVVSSGSSQGMDFNRQTNEFVEENSVFDRHFGNVDGLDELRVCRNDMPLKLQSNFDNFDRKGTSFHPNNYREEHGLAFGQQNMHSYSKEEIGHYRYSQGEDCLQANGHSTDVEQGRQSQDVATLYGEGRVLQNLGSGGGYLSASQKGDLNDQLHNNRNYHSHPTSWQGWSASSAPHHEQSNFAMENRNSNRHMSQPYAMQHHMQPNHDFYSHENHDGNQDTVRHQNMPLASQYGSRNLNKQGGYVSVPAGDSSIVSENITQMQTSGVFNVQPPLPVSPPPPITVGSAGHPLPPPKTSSLLFPIPVSSTATIPSSYAPIHEAHSLAQPYLLHKSHLHASTGFATEEFQTIKRASSRKYMGEGQPFPPISSDKQKVIDASHIFKQPHRATRPDHIVIILRGLPGSGKSYLAKMLRDLEVENGADAPRIHSMDDYFMVEVEKVEESDVSKSSGFVRGKKPIMKKVMEYCFEPEMEEAYRSSMLKAFKKTLDDNIFSFVIVDDRNLRVADFAQYWATAKRSGYEVYLLEATYKDPAGCAARNVHGFTQDDIQKMARQWEEAPSLYLKLDIKSLFHGEDSKESGIQEVDMDIEDGDAAGTLSGSEERSQITVPLRDFSPDGSSKEEKKWDAEGYHPREEVNELGRSKWSDDLDDDITKRSEANKGNLNALSGLIKAYTKEVKSVHWGDQVGNTGFSIGAVRKVNVSLVIGPGAGYNFKSNPLPEDGASTQNAGESKRQSVFQERIRAEHESFRIVFDKRRRQIGGLGLEEE
ncbi:YLP motif-containing protein 1 [Camellia lanceoleosa]|uniref:YLP motif-containing protein 1 n=1 Tax=Camellia lanceoleosa TaxID=1840588 RepID=A0ACC0FDN5_9ERIC|nr:YLP motif-containing protein 1 [Camellia lanceoleosa]